VLDGTIYDDWFEAYIAQVMVHNLPPGDVVIMKNQSSHNRAGVKERSKSASATLRFFPPYRPDFNPIEKAFSRLRIELTELTLVFIPPIARTHLKL
jgi:transposase